MHAGDLGYICALMVADSLHLRRPYRLVLGIVCLAVVAALSIAAALAVTPMQTVQVAGQVIKVGAVPALSISGPGQVSLFGQTLPTVMSFPGPIRPRLELSQITLNSELTNFVEGATPTHAGLLLRSDLISGWERYFGWEAALAGITALLLAGAVAGWRRLPARSTVWVLALALVVTELVNLGAIAVAANGARHALANVHSLNQLVGSVSVASQPVRKRPRVVTGVQEVVMGDSTAAGAGLPLVADPSAADRACGRSSESYSADLAAANGWKAVNLACDSATVRRGLLGSQVADGQVLAAQIGFASEISHPSVVIVSIGADDLQWAPILEVCAVSTTCDSRASAAYFQQKLAAFSASYLQLLIRLGSLPGHPRVIINRYYDPFGADIGCIISRGLTADKISTLSTWLSALNQVLARGAAQFGFLSPQPSFAGHQLCSPQPYVQGLTARAPFHPTPLGQLAIALADQAAITRAATTPAAPPRASTAPTSTASSVP
jgi:GDSL-like Lipase/Acylhydrolase family